MRTLAVAYWRVSSKGQLEGYGFDRQDERIQQFSKDRDFQIVRTFDDAWTGTDAERPGFNKLVRFCKLFGIRHVIVESMDRFARDSYVSAVLRRRLIEDGISLWTATTGMNATEQFKSDPMSKFWVQLQALLAELDKDLLVSKLKAGRKACRKKNGRCEGNIPYGKHPKYPGEQDVIARATQLWQDGFNPQQIADQLNSAGIRTRKGKVWRREYIYRLVDFRTAAAASSV